MQIDTRLVSGAAGRGPGYGRLQPAFLPEQPVIHHHGDTVFCPLSPGAPCPPRRGRAQPLLLICAPSLHSPALSLSQAHILSAQVLQSSGQEAKVNLKKKKKKSVKGPNTATREAGLGEERRLGKGELIWGPWWTLNPWLTSVALSHPRGQIHRGSHSPSKGREILCNRKSPRQTEVDRGTCMSLDLLVNRTEGPQPHQPAERRLKLPVIAGTGRRGQRDSDSSRLLDNLRHANELL